jgi:hypothetical protein
LNERRQGIEKELGHNKELQDAHDFRGMKEHPEFESKFVLSLSANKCT